MVTEALFGRSPHWAGFQVVGIDPWPELDHLIPVELRGDPGRDESREGAERIKIRELSEPRTSIRKPWHLDEGRIRDERRRF